MNQMTPAAGIVQPGYLRAVDERYSLGKCPSALPRNPTNKCHRLHLLQFPHVSSSRAHDLKLFPVMSSLCKWESVDFTEAECPLTTIVANLFAGAKSEKLHTETWQDLERLDSRLSLPSLIFSQRFPSMCKYRERVKFKKGEVQSASIRFSLRRSMILDILMILIPIGGSPRTRKCESHA